MPKGGGRQVGGAVPAGGISAAPGDTRGTATHGRDGRELIRDARGFVQNAGSTLPPIEAREGDVVRIDGVNYVVDYHRAFTGRALETGSVASLGVHRPRGNVLYNVTVWRSGATSPAISLGTSQRPAAKRPPGGLFG